MDIGYKLKKARGEAGFTQEEVAESLDVSRQTVSSWENEKTYPDIVSVIKMSKLYNISLDKLLKGEEKETGYISYLEKSTNTVKSNERKIKIILLSVYLSIFMFGILCFWLFTSPSDAFGYSFAYLWLLLPLLTLVLSFIIGKNNYFGRLKCLSGVAFGIMYMLAEYATFSAANMVAFDKLNMPRFELLLTGGVISLIGILIGILMRYKVVNARCVLNNK